MRPLPEILFCSALLFFGIDTVAAQSKLVLRGEGTTAAAPHGKGNIYAPDIIPFKGEQYMYYGGQGVDGHDRIHLATSTDGETWMPRGVVFSPDGVNHVNDPSVVQAKNELWMFYTIAAVGVSDSIGLAASKDGLTWEDQGVVFGPREAPKWDSLLVGRPSVLYEKGIFRMWFDGRADLPLGAPDATAPKSANSRRYVGYAESNDGIAWKRRDESVFGDNAGGVHVGKFGSQYVMCFESREGTKWASSVDGFSWKGHGILAAKGEDPDAAFGHVTPFLASAAGKMSLYYGAASSPHWNVNSIKRMLISQLDAP